MPAARVELESALVVVCEELGVVVGPAETFQPLARATVLLRSLATRDLPVGHVPEQDVLEGVLRVAGDRRRSFAADEVLPLQRAQVTVCIGGGHLTRRGDAAEPEHLAVNCRLPEQALLDLRESVEPRRDEALHGFRQLRGRPPLAQHARVLLGVQRVAARPLEQRSLVVGELERLLEQAGREGARFLPR